MPFMSLRSWHNKLQQIERQGERDSERATSSERYGIFGAVWHATRLLPHEVMRSARMEWSVLNRWHKANVCKRINSMEMANWQPIYVTLFLSPSLSLWLLTVYLFLLPLSLVGMSGQAKFACSCFICSQSACRPLLFEFKCCSWNAKSLVGSYTVLHARIFFTVDQLWLSFMWIFK